MRNFEVNVHNVKECWNLYEEYLKEYKSDHYSDDTNYEEFVNWCEENLMECPNCEAVVFKDEQSWLGHPLNTENVCDDCMEDCYGK